MGKIFKQKTDIQHKKSFQKSKVSLGMGGFSEVKLVYHKDDPETLYAMKKVKKRQQQKIENIHKEISLHSQLSHKNIIKFIDYLETANSYLFFLEYAEEGDMYNYIKKNELSLKEIVDYFTQICNAVEYLHNRNIMHRDLKLENILLTKNKEIKLCDFGWSAVFETGQNRETLCGTYEYMAYEIFLGQPQTVKTDIWALGIILYELFHRRPPFRAKNLPLIIQKIQNPRNNLIMDQTLPPQAQSLIRSILQVTPSKRPTIREILNHDFFYIDTNTCQQPNVFQNFQKKNIIQQVDISGQTQKKDFTSSQDTLFDKHSTVGTLNEKKLSFKKINSPKHENEKDTKKRESPTNKLFKLLYQNLEKEKNSKKGSNKSKNKSKKNSKKLKKKKTCQFEEQIENRNKSKTYTTQRLFQDSLFDQNSARNYSQNKRYTHKDRSQVSIRDQIKPSKHSVKVQKFSLVTRRESSTERNHNIIKFQVPDLGIKKSYATTLLEQKKQDSYDNQRQDSFRGGQKFVNSIYMQIQKQKQNQDNKIQNFKSDITVKSNGKKKSVSRGKVQIRLTQQYQNYSIGDLNEKIQQVTKQTQNNTMVDRNIPYKRYQSYQQGIQYSFREQVSTRNIKSNLNNGFLNIYSNNKRAQEQFNFYLNNIKCAKQRKQHRLNQLGEQTLLKTNKSLQMLQNKLVQKICRKSVLQKC